MASQHHRSADASTAIFAPDYERIARRIGLKLREMYGSPEATPLPDEHVDLLLRLRHKERDQLRGQGA